MRDRLIKLLQDNSYLDVLDEEHWLLAAEQLLANGVVVIDTDVISLPNRPLITQCMGRPIDEVINLIRRSEWISVDERLPENYGEYICCTGHKTIMQLVYNPKHRLFNVSYDNVECAMKVTHWMPLPEAPKMKGGE